MIGKPAQNIKKKLITFKIIAIILGIIAGLFIIELVLFIIPPKHQMDNPWYYMSGGGLSSSTDLPFERPPNLFWEGTSRGDMAFINEDDDPYAQYVTFRTDSEGFRNSSEIPTADLIAIGDSYTEAGNIPEDETYVSLLSQKLNISDFNHHHSPLFSTQKVLQYT